MSLLRLFVRAAARRTPWAVVLACFLAGTASASERYVLVVAGAAGSADHAEHQARWLTTLVTSLRGSLGLPADQVVVLGGPNADASARSTADNVRAAIRRLQQRAGREDVIAVVLIGHGTWDGVTAKFNLVGPDLDAGDWAALLAPLPSQVVFVNTTAASAPFLSELAGPRRVIVTATSSAAQRFDTVFAELLLGRLHRGRSRPGQGRAGLGVGGLHVCQRARQAPLRAAGPAGDGAGGARRHGRRCRQGGRRRRP